MYYKPIRKIKKHSPAFAVVSKMKLLSRNHPKALVSHARAEICLMLFKIRLYSIPTV